MELDFIVNMVVSQVGEEKAKEVKEMLVNLCSKMDDKKMYVIKRLGKKGVCLISTDNVECDMKFPNATKEKPPTIIELENIISKIDLE